MLGLVNNNRDKIYMQDKTRVEFERFIFLEYKDIDVKLFLINPKNNVDLNISLLQLNFDSLRFYKVNRCQSQ